MAVAFRAKGTSLSTTGTSRNIATPAGFAANDLLVVFIRTITGGLTWTPPAGFVSLLPATGVVGSGNIQIFWKIAAGTEGASQTFTCSSNTATWASFMAAYSGADGTNPIRGITSWVSQASSNTASDFRRIPLLCANSMAVWFWGSKTGVPTSGATGWTQDVSDTTTSFSLWSRTYVSAGYSDAFQPAYGAAWQSFPNMGFEICSAASISARTQPYVKQSCVRTFGTSVTTAAVQLPKNMTVGNVAVIWLFPMGTGATGITAAGWTIVTVPVSTTMNAILLWRVITGSEGASQTVTWTNASSPAWWCDEMVNCSTLSPINNIQTKVTGTSTTMASPTWLSSRDNILAVAPGWYNGVALPSGITTPASWIDDTSDSVVIEAMQEVTTHGTSISAFSKTIPSTNWGVGGFEFGAPHVPVRSMAVIVG